MSWGRHIICTHTHSQDGCTALLRAAESGHADCVRLLLDAGADKNAKNRVRVNTLSFCGDDRIFFLDRNFAFDLFILSTFESFRFCFYSLDFQSN